MSSNLGEGALIKAVCADGHLYGIYPLQWSLDKVQYYWQKCKDLDIFLPQYCTDARAFAAMVLVSNALWFEAVDLNTDEPIGICYLTDMVPMLNGAGLQSANWHAILWDSKATLRQPLARSLIRAMVQTLRIHRLQAEVPKDKAGVVRAAKRLGFTEEGVMRQERYDGEKWRDVVLLSLLDSEVDQWEG